MEIKQYIEKNKERFFEELFEVLRIPSVSSDPGHKDDMRRCAEKLASFVKAAGADKVEICETAGNPVVYAEKKIDRLLELKKEYKGISFSATMRCPHLGTGGI